MAYDEHLADRVRALMAETPGVAEKSMFGGLAFLIDGHMAVVVSGRGGIMVRVDPDASDKLVATTPAEFAEMRGRQMRGWLRLEDDAIRTARQLNPWVTRGAEFTLTLPPKR